MRYRVALIALAVAAALFPLPQDFVERHYARGWYLVIQSVLTPLSNLLPIAVLDLLAGAVLLTGIVIAVRTVRVKGARAAVKRMAAGSLTAAAAAYLVFLATWGLNYQRVPLEQKLAFEPARLDADAAGRLAAIAVRRANEGYSAAHATALRIDAIEAAFVDAQQILGAPRFAEPGRGKRSLLQFYFRWTAINGMTVPGFLEVILNPDLLPHELPFTVAHEWAHLAGYANESEANFVAWLACVRSPDPLMQYSGWLETYGLALQGVPRAARSSLPGLDEGPRRDLRAIADRLARASPRASAAARGAYDSYLKANRVEEGIRSYDAALRLMLGTTFLDNWKPVVR